MITRIAFCTFSLALANWAAAIPAGWTCVGNCGSSAPDGVVGASPFVGSSGHQWVSTSGGTNGVGGLAGVGGSGTPVNGSTLSTSLFTVGANAPLTFFFNYVTSDGAGFADYAWARLLDSSNNQASLLFTARTVSSGSIVPGFSMPSPNATLTPASVPIIGGAPSWSPLGASSGTCFASGCGYTGWVQSSFQIANAGQYRLQIGVTNWNDGLYQSGLALDGVVAGGIAIIPPSGIPEPTTLVLVPAGVFILAAARRKRGSSILA